MTCQLALNTKISPGSLWSSPQPKNLFTPVTFPRADYYSRNWISPLGGFGPSFLLWRLLDFSPEEVGFQNKREMDSSILFNDSIFVKKQEYSHWILIPHVGNYLSLHLQERSLVKGPWADHLVARGFVFSLRESQNGGGWRRPPGVMKFWPPPPLATELHIHHPKTELSCS